MTVEVARAKRRRGFRIALVQFYSSIVKDFCAYETLRASPSMAGSVLVPQQARWAGDKLLALGVLTEASSDCNITSNNYESAHFPMQPFRAGAQGQMRSVGCSPSTSVGFA